MVEEYNRTSSFGECSSYLNMFYYVVVALVSMFFMHPFVILMTFFSVLIFNVYLQGRKFFGFMLKILLPLFIFIVIINPIINHRGSTILFYLNDMMITKESILFGFFFGLTIINMIMLFSGFNKIMTSDKIINIFKGHFPKVSLVLTMVLRLVPRYKKEFIKINNAQKGIRESTSDGSFIDKIRHAVEIMLGLITFALEDGIDTADTMVMRGYELKGKSTYRREKVTSSDKKTIVMMVVLCIGILYSVYVGCFHVLYFPDFIITEIKWKSLIGMVCYGVFTLIPIIIEIKEEIIWNLSKQKI